MSSKRRSALRVFIAIIFLYFFLLRIFAQPVIGNELLATSDNDHASDIKPPVANFELPTFSIEPSTSNVNPKYEFRAAWIATVSNLDWPSRKGLPVEEQKEEYIYMLDSLQHIGINAVIVQVRPAADAFYPSPYEPWSEYLEGV